MQLNEEEERSDGNVKYDSIVSASSSRRRTLPGGSGRNSVALSLVLGGASEAVSARVNFLAIWT